MSCLRSINQIDINSKNDETVLSNRPIRVLIIINAMDAGGAETFIMKIYRTIDKEKIQFDFLINKKEKCFYEDEIAGMGGFLYRGISKSKNPIGSFYRIYYTVKHYNYSVVMCIAVHPLAAVDLFAAKIARAKKRLVRSTNSSAGGSWLSNVLAKLFRPLVIKMATKLLAPSTEAAVWLFGERVFKSGQVELIANGIEVNKYVFNEQQRLKIRHEFNIQDKCVLGHIGRFNKQKNHTFLLDVFSEVKKKCSEAVLVLVGKGELERDIKKKIYDLKLQDSVIFTGVRSDVPELLMGMDVLVFPSLYEGMPNVVIEAQATGLPCLISDAITREANITSIVKYISLSATTKEWAETLIAMISNYARIDLSSVIKEKGFNICETMKRLVSNIEEGE